MAEEEDGIAIKLRRLGLAELTGDERKSLVISISKFDEVIKEIIKEVPRIEGEAPGTSCLSSTSCEYQQLCCEVLKTLNIDGCYCDSKFDMCYCTRCHSEREDREPCLYGLPIAWCRFGLRTPTRTIKLKAFKQWHRAYHGTTLEGVSGILDTGTFVIPGHHVLGGNRLSQPEGHYTEKWKPEGFDEKKVFLSPSIHYAGLPVYAKCNRWQRSTNETYHFQVALQVLVRPSSYVQEKQTVLDEGDTTVFDQQFPNSEIEWSTKEYGSIIVYGLLIKIQDDDKQLVLTRKLRALGLSEYTGDERESLLIRMRKYGEVTKEILEEVPRMEDDGIPLELTRKLRELGLAEYKGDERESLLKSLRKFDEVTTEILEEVPKMEENDIPLELERKLRQRGLAEFEGGERKSLLIDLSKFDEVINEVIKEVPRIEDEEPGTVCLASSSCEYQQLCCEVLKTLNIDGCFFDSKYDMCYCTKCHEERGDQEYYGRGQPPCLYGLPIRWCRFGLRTPPRTIKLKAFKQWHRAYHGTTKEGVSGILDAGTFVIPGHCTLGGNRISQPGDHFTEDWKPVGFDEKKVFLSPSIHYAGLPVYAKCNRWERSHNEVYYVQVALQVLVKPSSYEKGKETVLRARDKTVFDKEFPNSEIEWSTKEYGSTICYGLLFKISDREKEWSCSVM